MDNLKNKELLDGRIFKIDQITTLTKTNSHLGVTSRERKTEIISNDGDIRISAKKKGGQFVEPPVVGHETAAVMKSVLQKNPKLADRLTSLIKKLFLKKGYSVLKNKSPEEKKKIKMIRNFFLKDLTIFSGF